VQTQQFTRVEWAPGGPGALREAWDDIQAIDLSLPRRKLLKPRWGKPIPEHVTDHAISDYRRFLFLLRKYGGESLSPTLDMDLVWHEHILDTQPYFDDTARVFGRYLHHEPGREPTGARTPELEKSFRRTCELYRQEFGAECQTFFGRDLA
jgi:hypothetical protein